MKKITVILLTMVLPAWVQAKMIKVEQHLDYGSFKLKFSINVKVNNYNILKGKDFNQWYEENVRDNFQDYYNKLDKKCKTEQELMHLMSINFIAILQQHGLEVQDYTSKLHVYSYTDSMKKNKKKDHVLIVFGIIVTSLVIINAY